MKEKYFKIGKRKENKAIEALIELIRPEITKDTVIVNCSPDYSSIISQRVIHAYFDNPLTMVNFDMPFPNTPFEKEYPEYCKKFVKNLDPDTHYVFIDSGVLRGRNFLEIWNSLEDGSHDSTTYEFASLYVQDDAVFTPKIYVEKFNREKDGMLLFWWENINCTLFG
jgi:hypothetical protein